MKITYEGQDYELDLDEMDTNQAKTIKAACGLTVMGLQRGMVEVDPDAMVGLYWLMKTQAGERCNIRAVNFKVAAFANALSDAILNNLTDEQRQELEDATGVDLSKPAGTAGKEDAPKEST